MRVLDLGIKTYEETWELQKKALEDRASGRTEDTLILVEHPPVYTIGRAGLGEDAALPTEILVRKLGKVPVVEVERGGKLTFHGPGQLVGYPIFALPHHDLRLYLRDLERILVQALSEETMLPAKPCPETLLLDPGQLQTGVWIRDKKVASIGIAVKRWVAYHGFALNLATDLRYFEAVNPCGFQGSIMTSVRHEMGRDAEMSAITKSVKQNLIRRFEELSRRYQSHAISQKVSETERHPEAEAARPDAFAAKDQDCN